MGHTVERCSYALRSVKCAKLVSVADKHTPVGTILSRRFRKSIAITDDLLRSRGSRLKTQYRMFKKSCENDANIYCAFFREEGSAVLNQYHFVTIQANKINKI